MTRRRARSRAQTLAEFALVLPVFLLMVFGLIDMGRYVYLSSTLSQAAREAARVGAVEAYWIGNPIADPSCNQPGGPVCPASLAILRTDMLAAANRMLTPFAAVPNADFFTSCDAAAAPTPVTTQTCSVRSTGSLVSVRVRYVFRPLTPIIGNIFSSITTSGSATMVIN